MNIGVVRSALRGLVLFSPLVCACLPPAAARQDTGGTLELTGAGLSLRPGSYAWRNVQWRVRWNTPGALDPAAGFAWVSTQSPFRALDWTGAVEGPVEWAGQRARIYWTQAAWQGARHSGRILLFDAAGSQLSAQPFADAALRRAEVRFQGSAAVVPELDPVTQPGDVASAAYSRIEGWLDLDPATLPRLDLQGRPAGLYEVRVELDALGPAFVLRAPLNIAADPAAGAGIQATLTANTPPAGFFPAGTNASFSLALRDGAGTPLPDAAFLERVELYVSGPAEFFRGLAVQEYVIDQVGLRTAVPLALTVPLPANALPGTYHAYARARRFWNARSDARVLTTFQVGQAQATTSPSLPPSGWMKCGSCHAEGEGLAAFKVHNVPASAGMDESLRYCVTCHTADLGIYFGGLAHEIEGHHGFVHACATCHADNRGLEGKHPQHYVRPFKCQTCHAGWYKPEHWGGTDDCQLCHVEDRFSLTEVAGHTIPPGTYIGSETCKGCHWETYDTWETTFHSMAIKVLDDQEDYAYWPPDLAVIGDFTQNPTVSGGGVPPVTIGLAKQNDQFFMTLDGTTYRVDRTQGGNGWKQRYHTRIGDSYYILPLQWNMETQEWAGYNLNHWFDASGRHNPQSMPPKDRSYDKQCAGCHATGYRAAQQPDGDWVATHKEHNIGCESCHGRGSDHLLRGGGRAAIVNPAEDLPAERALEVCGACHSRGRSMPSGTFGYPYSETDGTGFEPGEVLAEHLSDQGVDWPDGTSRQHYQQYLDHLQSGHWNNPLFQVQCFDCHMAHGSDIKHDLVSNPDDNRLCITCHAVLGLGTPEQISAHTHHAYDPQGELGLSRCTKCHMPKVVTSAVPYDLSAHTFETIAPSKTVEIGMPNSCAVSCHRDLAVQRGYGPGADDASPTDWTELSDTELAQWLGRFYSVWFEDRDGDGMPDAWEEEHGFNADDPADAAQDADGDGATNLVEFQDGTDPHDPGQVGDRYAGSQICQNCHPGRYASWRGSFHSKAIKVLDDPDDYAYWPPGEAVVGDFAQDPSLSGGGVPPVTIDLAERDGAFFVTLDGTTYPVDRTQGGNGWKQRYHTRIGDSYYVLPVQWNMQTEQWVAYHLEHWFDASGRHDPQVMPAKSRSYDKECEGCHATGYRAGEQADGDWVATHQEHNIGCEACHGPALAHTYSLDPQAVIQPETDLSPERALEVCGACHNRGRSMPDGTFAYPYNDTDGTAFEPGEVLAEHLSDGGGDWPDGTSRQHRQQYLDYVQSKHWDNPYHRLQCYSCHDPHGGELDHDLVMPSDDNALCLSCHASHGFASQQEITLHTQHSFDPTGPAATSRCTKCHMAKVATTAVAYDIHAHTFSVMSPQSTLGFQQVAGGQPNSCSVSCHRQRARQGPIFYPGHDDRSLTDWREGAGSPIANADIQLADFLSVPYSYWLWDLDGDGRRDSIDLDDDGDGMPDVYELGFADPPAPDIPGLNMRIHDGAQDNDGDGYPNRSEYGAGTHPLDAASLLAIVSIASQPGGAVEIRWHTVAGRQYRVLGSGDLSEWTALSDPIAAQEALTTWADAAPAEHRFYRVEVLP